MIPVEVGVQVEVKGFGHSLAASVGGPTTSPGSGQEFAKLEMSRGVKVLTRNDKIKIDLFSLPSLSAKFYISYTDKGDLPEGASTYALAAYFPPYAWMDYFPAQVSGVPPAHMAMQWRIPEDRECTLLFCTVLGSFRQLILYQVSVWIGDRNF